MKTAEQLSSPANKPIMPAPCVTCHSPTSQRCGRCKVLYACSEECFRAVWPAHKEDCNNISNARSNFPDGVPQSPNGVQAVPAPLSVERLVAINELSSNVYRRYSMEVPPTRASNMSAKKKIAFFLDMLEANDSSSAAHDGKPLPEKFLLNRRFNNTYRTVNEVLRPAEFSRFERMMRQRQIGAHNK
jgi:hypothetical protein